MSPIPSFGRHIGADEIKVGWLYDHDGWHCQRNWASAAIAALPGGCDKWLPIQPVSSIMSFGVN
jgi:hypothetical protein